MSEDNITKENRYDHYNMTRDEMLDSWNSEYMKNIRLKMIAGEEVTNCQRCIDSESQGLTSMRTIENKEKFISATNKDGSVDQAPTSLELHFGNTCNLQCKMCSQQYSHMIGKELLKMGEQDPEFLKWVKKESGVLNNWTGELDIAYDWYKNEKIKKSIFEHVSKNVNTLTVIGGEPTIIKEFYELLEYCSVQDTLQDKSLTITTNMTNTSKNLSTWLGAVQHFTIHASIDGLDARNKYIRYPCDWNSVLKAMAFYKETIKKHKNGHFSFSPAIQLLNIDQLHELCTFFIENFISKKCHIAWVSQVRYPIVCDYAILPTEHRLKIADRLETATKNMDHADTVTNLLGHANDLRTEPFSSDQQKMYQKMFVRYNDQQDKFRNGTTWRTLLPELEEALTKSLK
jgi:organic radical activating enzyme